MFVNFQQEELQLEHSLISLAKWESKWHKPWMSKQQKTEAEAEDYVRCMVMGNKTFPLDFFKALPTPIVNLIHTYIAAPMTATWFSDHDQKASPLKDVVTAEILYWQMIQCNIPFECEKWHLNRLMTLIKVCSVKANTKKRSKVSILTENQKLNLERRKALGTNG